MDIDQGTQVGRYVVLRDHNGLRHAIRRGSVVAASDSDPCQDATLLQLPGGRALVVAEPFETVLAWLEERPCR